MSEPLGLTFRAVSPIGSFPLIKERLRSQEPDVEKLEKKINCGQIEEVISQVGHCNLANVTVSVFRQPQ